MEFQDVVRKRRMVRAFEPSPLPRDVVERILVNAQRGPSSGFTQGFEFLVFDGAEQTDRFWRYMASRNDEDPSSFTHLTSAPLVIVPVAHPQAYIRRYREPDKLEVGRETAEDWPAPYWFIDTAFAALLILLTAVDSELGGYYFSLGPTSRDIPPFREAFGIPEEYYPIGAIAIGHPAPDRPSPSLRRGHRPPSDVMHFGRW